MTYILCFSAAVLLLLIGHLFRTLRWKLFIMTYERPNSAQLLGSLAVGYSINFFIPFRIGDIVRAIISGRKLKNGIPFSLATIIVEHCLDIPIVCLIFSSMFFLNTQNEQIYSSMIMYLILTAVLFVLGIIAIIFSNQIKALAKLVCSIFNHKIEYGLLFFLWGLITSFKDIFKKISKVKLLLYSAVMWAIYLLSYLCLTFAITESGTHVRFSDTFSKIFSQGGFSTSNLNLTNSENNFALNIFAYIGVSLVLLVVLSLIVYFYQKNKMKDTTVKKEEKILNLLPWINEKDRLHFLESYFSNHKSDDLKKYIELNRDIHIIQDYSAGSNATTMLCMNEDTTFYRKYALGGDGEKLYEQVQWLHEHERDLPLPVIINQQHSQGFCIYDMEFNQGTMGLFNYIHSTSGDKSWAILEEALNCLRAKLHTKNARPADKELTKKYIDSKVTENVKRIENGKEIKPLLEYDTLFINGEEYKNLKKLKKWLKPEYLMEVFKDDEYSDIHGDLTIENIVCFESNPDQPYYFIDPNTGNLHDSPALDYGKLLQSLHGGYEFLMRTETVSVTGNEITFISASSRNYSDIFKRYKKYLEENFTKEQVRSIFFHEVIHWLRLMPYKLKKNGIRAVIFYAGFIKIFNDTVEWFGDI